MTRLSSHPTGSDAPPIKVGRFAPFPVWFGVAILARGSQLVFIACCLWYLAALFDAMDKRWTIDSPPIWLWIVSAMLGVSAGRSAWVWKTSPMGDAIGNLLASQQCPACGQNVFDHTPPKGYAPPSKKLRMLPSRICTNCGHDLSIRDCGL